jgi:hypothetical protein
VINTITIDNTQKNNEILYTEWVPAGGFVKTIVLIVFLLFVSLGIVFTVLQPLGLSYIGIIFGVVGIFIFLFYWNYRGLNIIITKSILDVEYGVFNRKRIPLSKITSCETTKARFRTYGGIGIRLGVDGSWAYNTDFGDAVKLTLIDGRPFVFSTRNPQKICTLIHELAN